MTELDFDELDKAVSDLMQDAAKQGMPVQELGANTEPKAGSDAGVSPDKPVTATPPAAPAPLAMRRRGRFMDVMAPGSVKKPLADNLVAHKPTAVNAEPTESVATPPVNPVDNTPSSGANDDQPIAIDTAVSTTAPNDGGDYAADPAPAHEWPEPNEVTNMDTDSVDASKPGEPSSGPQPVGDDVVPGQGSTISSMDEPKELDTVPEAVPVKIESTQPDSDTLTTVVNPDQVPSATSPTNVLPGSVMASPFLPGAKVEKRPLGGEAATDQATVAPHEPEPLPREYGSDLMNLEADNSAAVHTAPTQQAQAPANTSAADQAPAGTIFDTDAYHAPLKQPVKTKSGWLTLIWIFALLIIGAIAGAVYYFYSIQQ